MAVTEKKKWTKSFTISIPYPSRDEISNIFPRTRRVIHLGAMVVGYSMVATCLVGCISGVFLG